MASSKFVEACQLSFLTFKNAEGYTCICGLKLGSSVDEIDPGDAGPMLQAAHAFHHSKHFGNSATLYMQGEATPLGHGAIAEVWCSCGYGDPHA